jgi:hypothetical protein
MSSVATSSSDVVLVSATFLRLAPVGAPGSRLVSMAAHAEILGTGAADPAIRRETEWQLSAHDLNVVRQWLSDHHAVDGFTIEPRPAQTIYDTYLDTQDLRIRRAGFALRLRDLPGRAEATEDLAPGPTACASAAGSTSRSLQLNGMRSRSADRYALACRQSQAQLPEALFLVRTRRQCFAIIELGDWAAEIALDGDGRQPGGGGRAD